MKFYTTQFLCTLYAMHLVTINKRWISRNEQKYLSLESWVIRISKNSFGEHLAALILVQNLIKKALLNFTRRFIYQKKLMYLLNLAYLLQLQYFIFWINLISYFSSNTWC